eukprot:7457037-Alexandrium_andersonii.AAC.1
MSASLVGSEMCIRDRTETRRGGGCEGAARGSPRRIARPGVRGRPSARAVSYTHLTLPTICSV